MMRSLPDASYLILRTIAPTMKYAATPAMKL